MLLDSCRVYSVESFLVDNVYYDRLLNIRQGEPSTLLSYGEQNSMNRRVFQATHRREFTEYGSHGTH